MKNEPTIIDVMGVVKDLAVSVKDLTEAVQGGFAKIESSIFTLQTGQQNLSEQVGDIQRRVINLEHGVEDMKESLIDITNAEEKDAEATINHEHRISHLEKLSGIAGIPVAHLVGLES